MPKEDLAHRGEVARNPGELLLLLPGQRVLIAAAGGGVVLNLGYHLRTRPLPIWLVLVHAAIAVAAFALLALAAWDGKA